MNWRRLTGAVLAAGGLALTVIVFAGGATGATTTTTATTTTAAPKNTSPPTLTGTTAVGDTLTATPGSWSGAGTISFTYRYLRCDAKGGNCYAGKSTTQKTYVITAGDLGGTIRVEVTATSSGGSTTATSAPSAVVTAAALPTPAPTGCPSGSGTIQIGDVAPPARLLVDGQDASPSVIGRSTQQIQVRFHVSACNGRNVQGALVYVTAVPYNQFSIPSETATGSDGWATMTLTRLSGFPADAHQQLLAVFVRARKPAENLLAGVSTRRLISFPVNLNR